jgi:hypothetical protein
MTYPRTFRLAACALPLLACGPKPPAGDTEATSDATTTAPASTGPTSTTEPTSTDATGSTGSSSSSTTGTSTGCSFLDCTGSATGTITEECDLFSQDCSDGMKCTASSTDGVSWNTSKCVDVAPNPGKPGDPCTVEAPLVSGKDTCDKGSMCWDIDKDTLMGTCVALCTGSFENPQCTPGSSCLLADDGYLNLCIPSCDPLAQDCAPMEVCVPVNGEFLCLPAVGDAPQNAPCTFSEECSPGLACSHPALASECDPMVSGCCLPFCDLSNPMCTNQGAVCLPWYEMGMAPPGFENLGICALSP